MKSLPIRFMNYFLACFLAGVNIPLALAEDIGCEETGAAHIWIAPLNPKTGEPVKMMVVSTDGPVTELTLIDNQGRRTALQSHRRGGPPWSLLSGLEEGDGQSPRSWLRLDRP